MINRESKLILQMVVIALGIAGSVLLTSFVFIPLPLGGGFLNFTDVFVVFYALFFGPLTGGLVGALSGLMVDLILGYGFYAPFTFAIKLVEGLVVGFIFHKIKSKMRFIGPFVGGLLMAILYFLPDYLILHDLVPTLVNLGFNVVQGMIGASVGLALYLIIIKTKIKPPNLE